MKYNLLLLLFTHVLSQESITRNQNNITMIYSFISNNIINVNISWNTNEVFIRDLYVIFQYLKRKNICKILKIVLQ